MIPDYITQLIQQVPALAVLAFVVVTFLKHLEKIEKRCCEASDAATKAIQDNTEALSAIKTIIGQLEEGGTLHCPMKNQEAIEKALHAAYKIKKSDTN